MMHQECSHGTAASAEDPPHYVQPHCNTCVPHLHSPAVLRAVGELSAEGAGVGGQVPVGDGEELGLGTALAHSDVPRLSLGAVVVHIQQGEEQRARARGRR